MLEGDFRARNRDLVVSEADLTGDHLDISLAQGRIIGGELVAKCLAEALHYFGSDAPGAALQLPFEAFNAGIERGYACAVIAETLGEHRIPH